MPRRSSSSKRLNISTSLKSEEHGAATTGSNNGARYPPLQPQHTTLEAETSMKGIDQPSDLEADTNDSRVTPANAPQHVAATLDHMVEQPRLQQINEILSHRKLLLLRIRQSKTAAELRFKQFPKRTIASTLAEYEGGEEKSEIEAYKVLTKIALNAAKKQRDDEKQPTEKSVPLTLRRGASVGKRMNAAIPALSSGQASELIPSESSQTAPFFSAIMPPKKMKQTIQASAPLGKTISHEAVKKRASLKSHKAHAARAQQQAQYSYSVPHLISISEPPPKQAVIFPEAIALRERRNQVQAKLNIMLDERQRVNTKTKESMALRKDVSIRANKLPQRRKTHFDYLLEEMRWMATDFVEERKWKTSSARILSCGVLSHSNELLCKADGKAAAEIIKEDGKIIEDEKKESDEVNSSSVGSQPIDAPSKRLYFSPSEADKMLLRSHARKLSNMVLSQWECILEPRLDSGTIDAEELRQLSGEGSAPVNESIHTDSAPTGDDSKDRTSNFKALSHHNIGEKVDALLERIEQRPRQRTRSKQGCTRRVYTLSPVEQKASDFVEFLWNADIPAGAILGDSFSFSPYDVTSSLLKQHQGPCLVLCRPVRLLPWASELKRLNSATKVHLVSDHMDLASIIDLMESDIVVCELSSRVLLARFDLSMFASVVLDGSLPVGSSHIISQPSARDGVHNEFLSESFWDALLRSMSSKNQRRLLITNSSVLHTHALKESLLCSLSERERMCLIAGMTAFILGPDLFQKSKKHPAHRVLSWAKQRVKKEMTITETITDLVESHLVDLLRKMMFLPDDHFDNIQDSFEKKTIVNMEIMYCKMSTSQQTAYDTVCRSLRGALSFGGTLSDAARGIMQLRDVCFHACLRDVCMPTSANSAQPDVHRALEIINESAKLRETVILLHRDYGYYFQGMSVLQEMIPELQSKLGRVTRPLKGRVAKIAIAASSPLVQRLTSVLLSSLGICHENLTFGNDTPGLSSALRGNLNPEKLLDRVGDDLYWAEKQISLMRYSNEDVDLCGFPCPTENYTTPRAANIIVGSLKDIAQLETGLSVEASDAILLLDEDWSGRECQLAKRMLVHCFMRRARHEPERDNFHVYRFVCSDSCEDKFLSAFKHNNSTEVLCGERWTVSSSGMYELDKGAKEKIQSFSGFNPQYVFTFPALNLVSYMDEDVASILVTKESFPANLESGKELQFLPFKTAGASPAGSLNEMIMSFVKQLVGEEIVLRSMTAVFSNERTATHNSAPTIFFSRTSNLYMESFARARQSLSTTPNDGFSSSPGYSSLLHFNAGVSHRESAEEHAFTPLGTCASVLFYSREEHDKVGQTRKRTAMSSNLAGTESLSGQQVFRANVFSSVFSTSASDGCANIQDGSQGWEPLIYFPPIFPGQRQVSIQATKALSEIRSKKRQRINEALVSDYPKRALITDNNLPDAKRQRVEPCLNGSQTSISKSELVAEPPTQGAVVSLPPLPFSFESPDPCNDLSRLPADSLHPDWKTLLVDLDEDFGTLGTGAAPFQSQSFKEASQEGVDITDYYTCGNLLSEYGAILMHLPCDFEDAQSAVSCTPDTEMDSVILFVSKKVSTRSHHLPSQAFNGHQLLTSLSAASPALIPVPSAGAPLMNGVANEVKLLDSGPPKKIKKATTPTSFLNATVQPVGPSAPFVAHPQASPPVSATAIQVKGKDAMRHKILAMYGRQGYRGPGLFESSKFRVASLRVRDRICDRLALPVRKIVGTSTSVQHVDPSNALQCQVDKSPLLRWTTHVASPGYAPDQNHQAGTSSADFGPFKVGNLLDIDPVARIPDAIIGVRFDAVKSLEFDSLSPPKSWSSVEDEALHALARRFSVNWDLISENLFDSKNRLSKTAKECCQRWCQLSEANPSMCDEIQNLCRGLDVSLFRPQPAPLRARSQRIEVIHRLLLNDGDDMAMTVNEDHFASIPTTFCRPMSAVLLPEPEAPSSDEHLSEDRKKNRSFAALCAASTKKQHAPTVIPGVAPGQKPALSTPHPSHQQSLQAAIAALSTGGRTEMWPLQILDLADKQKKAAASPTPAVRSPRSHHVSIGSYQAPHSRHTPIQQQYPPPTNN